MHPLDAFFVLSDPDRQAHDRPGTPALVAALETVSDAVFALDREWRFVYLNAHAETLLKRQRADLLGTVGWEAFPVVVGTIFEREYRRAMDTGVPVAFEAQYPDRPTWFAVRARPSPAGLVVYAQDITSRKVTEAEVRFQGHLLDHVEVAVIATDVRGSITHWNAHATRLYGWSRAEALGRSVGDLTVGHHDPAVTAATWARLRQGISWSGEFQGRRKDDSTFHAHVTDAPIRDAEGRLVGIIGVSQDISERKARENGLTHRASHDALTGLPNRAHFLDRLARCLEAETRTCAVLFLDLDHFKPINDRHGHDMGDRLLIAVAERLRGPVRDSDTLAQLGGDEFTLLIDRVADAAEAERIADRLMAALAEPIALDGYRFGVTASVGIALCGPAHHRPEDVLRDADAALYRAKAAGRGKHQRHGEVGEPGGDAGSI